MQIKISYLFEPVFHLSHLAAILKHLLEKNIESHGESGRTGRIVLTGKAGISKVYFTELPKDVQERFGYDSQKACVYSAQQSAGFEQVRKTAGRSIATARAGIAKRKSISGTTSNRQNDLRTLQSNTRASETGRRFASRIGEGKAPGPAYGAVKTINAPLAPNPKHRSCHCSESSKGRSSRERPGQKHWRTAR